MGSPYSPGPSFRGPGNRGGSTGGKTTFSSTLATCLEPVSRHDTAMLMRDEEIHSRGSPKPHIEFFVSAADGAREGLSECRTQALSRHPPRLTDAAVTTRIVVIRCPRKDTGQCGVHVDKISVGRTSEVRVCHLMVSQSPTARLRIQSIPRR